MDSINRRNLFFAVALALFGVSGVSLFSMPDYEVYYACDESPDPFCTSEMCITSMGITIGNTGRKLEEHVTIRLDPEINESFALPFSVRNHGKVPRKYTTDETDTSLDIILSDLKPKDSVVLSFVFDGNKVSNGNLCATVLQSIELTHGVARKGMPDAVRFFRMLYFFFA